MNSEGSELKSYYSEQLAAESLRRCYDIAPPRVKQYLLAEVDHVLEKISSLDLILDLGCGYGRVVPELAKGAQFVVGIDISLESLLLGKKFLKKTSNCFLSAMDAVRLGFPDDIFDLVVCLQNGISAFHVDQNELLRESYRVTKQGGLILFSTYHEKFWADRLEWFRLQSEAGLLGPIDEEKTGGGVIVCQDGFEATTVSAKKFFSLAVGLKGVCRVVEVDDSSLFLEIRKEI